MSGSGTGLPGAGSGGVTPHTDLSRSFGAGEQAAADAFGGAVQGLGRLMNALEPAANAEAETLGAQAADAGEFEQRLAITSADQAFNHAMTTGFGARLENEDAAFLTEAQVRHAYDPQGFEAATTAYREQSLADNGRVPAAMAIDWSLGFDRRRAGAMGTVQAARARLDLDEARSNTLGLIDRLTTETIGLTPGAPIEAVLASDDVQGNLLQITLAYDALAANPAFGLSDAEITAKRDETLGRIKAGAASSHAIAVLRSDGADAALAELQALQTNPDLPFTSQAERTLAFNTARDAVAQELALTNQRRNQADAERNAAEREAQRLVDDDIARIELTGQGSGLTEEQVRTAGGLPAVSAWLKRRADAQEFHGLVGSLPLGDPDAAAAQIAQATATRGLDAIPMVQDEGDLTSVAAAIEQVESGGRNGLVSADPDGAGPAGGGAFGLMQVLPGTAQRIAARQGLPYDQNRLRNDREYNRRIGTAYLAELTERYRGDTFLAITAYHAGEGNVDGWLASVGDPRSGTITREAWLDGVESRGNPRSAAYPRRVLAAMNGGRAAAAWNGYQANRQASFADPGASVAREAPVRIAITAWTEAVRAGGDTMEEGEALVRASLGAQERAGIPAGRRRTLPNSMLMPYAQALAQLEGDPPAYTRMTDRILDHFGEQGDAVLQDVLTLRGHSAYASQVATSATRAARTGAPAPAPAAVAAANRVETVSRAAAGTRSPSDMTDAEISAALGASPL